MKNGGGTPEKAMATCLAKCLTEQAMQNITKKKSKTPPVEAISGTKQKLMSAKIKIMLKNYLTENYGKEKDYQLVLKKIDVMPYDPDYISEFGDDGMEDPELQGMDRIQSYFKYKTTWW